MISQKATILCVYEILRKFSDENHLISTEKIREKLKTIYDVDMERRAIYRNIDALRSMGIDIEGYTDNREGYYLIDRTFETSEVRLLCDAVASSDMIKEEMSKNIIKKLIDTQSVFQGRLLQKTIYVKNRKNSINKQLFYNIDTLNLAINQGCKVSIQQLQYNADMQLEAKENESIIISPYATMWAYGKYYILAKDENSENLTHYRIDFLNNITLLEQSVDMLFGGLNPTQYAEHFIMHNGEYYENYHIECNKALWLSLAEVFGSSATVFKEEKEIISLKIKCTPSLMKSWVMQHLNDCEVISPKSFRDEIQSAVMEAYKTYWK